MANIFNDFLNTPVENIPTTTASLGTCPNKFPTLNHTPYRIAIIGEAPGESEILQQQPFVGQSGKLLTGLLTKANILREACFIGNICQQRPPDNNIALFSRDGTEIQSGLEQLKKDLDLFDPHICLLLGKTALWAAGYTDLFDRRGSVFVCNELGPLLGRKCLASYHPAYCLRQSDATPILAFDIKKVRRHGESKEPNFPIREIRLDLSALQIVEEIEKITNQKQTIAIDIEGGVSSMSCISVATSPHYVFIVPFQNLDGTSYWKTEEEEYIVWEALAKVLGDSNVAKILQNSLYDRFVLQYSYNIIVSNTKEDIMLKHWEMYCELEKNLGFQASIYTDEPYYKSDIDSNNRNTFFAYCCKDSAVTYEISLALDRLLDPQQLRHYRFNMALLNPILYMELKGIKYDKEKAKQRLEEVKAHIYTLQARLDAIACCGIRHGSLSLVVEKKSTPTANIFASFIETDEKTPKGTENNLPTGSSHLARNQEVLRAVSERCCYVRDKTRPKKEFEEEYYKIVLLLKQGRELTEQEVGYINTVCKWSMNLRSDKFKTYLYSTLKLPPKYKVDPKTKVKRPTTDFDALLKLKKETSHPVIDLAIDIGLHRTRAQFLSILPDRDGRMRTSLNIVGSETGRITSSRTPIRLQGKRVGTNMQTVSDDWDIPEEGLELVAAGLRDLYSADEDCWLAQMDLKGSDGWTIGAHLAKLGDSTMLEDLKAGLKPAQIVAYLLRHITEQLHGLKGLSRDQIREFLKEITKECWEYFVSKQGIWGTSYTMGYLKLIERVLNESFGKVVMTSAQSKAFQSSIKQRYAIDLWHRSCQRTINTFSGLPTLTAPSGQKRKFFGRYTDILGEWLAHEPQVNTTYATNLAALRLWCDPENRVYGTKPYGCDLKIQPLHQVHDALITQFKKAITEWAKERIRTYFNNELLIAGQHITIPFDGAYGESWGNLEAGKI